MARPRPWDSLPWWEQAAQNLEAFRALHRQEASPDWPETRVKATLAADRRLRAYEREREHRFAAYESGASSEAYRRRWKERSGVVIDFDFVAPKGGSR